MTTAEHPNEYPTGPATEPPRQHPSLRASAFRARYGSWAVVAGGSEGIGAAFAEALARRGLSLVLLARRPEPLAATAQRLRDEHGVEVRTLALDLASAAVAVEVAAATAELDVGLLVCSAAVSRVAPFFAVPLAEKERMLDVNCRAPLALVHALGERMLARGRGGIVLLSSLAGIYGGPYVATYAASKAFLCLLAESLAEETAAHGVDVLACVAGPTRTPTYAREASGRFAPMEPATVAEQTLAALGHKTVVIPGSFNRLSSRLLRLLPRRWLVKLVAAQTRKLLVPPP
jgi:short-subunit dehydrogenase